MAHVLDNSIHHVYTDLKFIGKCDYIKLPSQYLWDTTSLQKKNSSSGIAILLHNCLPLFSVLRLTYLIPYTCKSWFMLGCVHCFQLQKVIKIHISYGVRLSASRPTPNLEDQGIPFSLGHHLDLSGMGGFSRSYVTARIALNII